MDRKEKGAFLDKQVDDAIADLEFELSQGHSERYLEVLEFHARFWRYSIGNTILIAMQRKDATLVAGYKKWESLGFHVKVGEKGIAIRAPWLRKMADPDTGEITERLVGYIPTYVWDITQTVEYPDKQPPMLYQPVPGNWDDLYKHIKLGIFSNGVLFTEDPMPREIHGMYSNGRIFVNEALEPFHKITCAVHEYVHHVAHGTPEKREGLSRQQREWEAESVTFAVCKAIGIEHDTARDYLLQYGFTIENLAESVKKIQTLTKRVLNDLCLMSEVKKSEAEAA